MRQQTIQYRNMIPIATDICTYKKLRAPLSEFPSQAVNIGYETKMMAADNQYRHDRHIGEIRYLGR